MGQMSILKHKYMPGLRKSTFSVIPLPLVLVPLFIYPTLVTTQLPTTPLMHRIYLPHLHFIQNV